MKVITGTNEEVISKFLDDNDIAPVVESFNVHPTKIEETAKNFVESYRNSDIYLLTYNTSFLDYIPVDLIVYIDENGIELMFKDVFEEKLGYMFPGEIYGNI